jgi:DNA-binding NtrC family response regulator
VTESRDFDGHEAILLMEHDESLRVVIRSILEYRGYRIITVATGEEAIEKFVQAQPRFDLVLLDLDVPRSAGREAVAKIRQHDPAVAIIPRCQRCGKGANGWSRHAWLFGEAISKRCSSFGR